MKVTVPATPSFLDSTQNHSAKKSCLKYRCGGHHGHDGPVAEIYFSRD